MFDVEKTALLRAVLDEVCKTLPKSETGVKAHIAFKILQAAQSDDASVEVLKSVGHRALSEVPTMWQ